MLIENMSIEEIAEHLKSRCEAVLLVALLAVDGEEQMCKTEVYPLGNAMTCVGMCEFAKGFMLAEAMGQGPGGGGEFGSDAG